MTVVAFAYSAWNTRYPEFATTVNAGQAQDCFTQATLYLDNTDGSIVQDIPTRTMLLYMLTAHIAQLRYGSALKPANALVGRIDSATEGSVSVSVKAPEGLGILTWLQQTPYGLDYWAATSRYRTAKYIPGRRLRTFP